MKNPGLLVLAFALIVTFTQGGNSVLSTTSAFAATPATVGTPVKKVEPSYLNMKGVITSIDLSKNTFTLSKKTLKEEEKKQNFVFSSDPETVKVLAVGEKVSVSYEKTASGVLKAVLVNKIEQKKAEKKAGKEK